ncbi:Bug family tripartite tricarboxylate transporter substrate binding protein [Halomonas sp. AOP5-B2-8]
MKTTRRSVLGTGLATFLLLTGLSLSAAAQDFPTRSIEFIAGYGPGGGHDTMMRSMATIIRQLDLSEPAIAVVNKPGGSGASSMGYLNTHKEDGHYLMAATSSFITTPLSVNVGLSHEDFTPIARLGIDPTILVVGARSSITNLDDIKNADRMLNVAGGGTGGIEHIATLMVSDALGANLNYIPFQGDGEVTTALLSGQIDFAMINPGAVTDFISSGRLKALAITTEERTELFPDIPTFTEEGYDVVAYVFRGLVAPQGISDEAKVWLSNLVAQVQATPEWKTQYLDPNSIIPDYQDSDEFATYLEETETLYETMLARLGLIGE